MLNSFWNWFVIIITIGSILGCWWLLHWTKGVSDREGEEIGSTGHIWDENIRELNAPLPRWWLHLFNITIVFALVYLILFPGLGNVPGVKGWSQTGQYDAEISAATATQETVYARFREMDPAALMADSEANEIGRRLFGNNCAMCHGSDGRGATGFPNLTDNDWLYGGSFDQVLTSINTGRVGTMPPWGPVLGEDGVTEVVAYVQQLAGHESDAQLAAAGKARYDTVCIACHGVDGRGNQALGAPDLTNDIWLYGGDPSAIAETVILGRAGKMPAHENLLNEDRRRLLAAYVIGLAASQPQ
jgi:cytochrome c oxidase cbb3-type subunit 3